jgi:hypothetical protein
MKSLTDRAWFRRMRLADQDAAVRYFENEMYRREEKGYREAMSDVKYAVQARKQTRARP